MKLVLASGNRGKLAELRDLLADAGVELVAQSDLGIGDAEETGATFVENAILKARHAAHASGLPALADDSGLCVDALDGAPGLLSARYAGTHGDSAANIVRLLAALEGTPRIVAARTSIARSPSCATPRSGAADRRGRWRGRILESARGDGGHGYDPVFLDPASGLSAAELEPAAKNAISHRGLALTRLRELLAGGH